MKRNEQVVCDAGPIIAIIDRRDKHHDECVEFLKSIVLPMVTVWPVLCEAWYLLEKRGGRADEVLHWVEARHLRILRINPSDAARMRSLMEQYSDLPMDLADAALVATCERENLERVFTIDRRDFSVYRPRHTSHFQILP